MSHSIMNFWQRDYTPNIPNTKSLHHEGYYMCIIMYEIKVQSYVRRPKTHTALFFFYKEFNTLRIESHILISLKKQNELR